MKSTRRYNWVQCDIGFGLVLGLVLTGCQEKNTYIEPPPPKVTVAQPLVQEVIDFLEFTGTTVASEQVEVVARVAGVLQSMHFTPGTQVKRGGLLFVIDPVASDAAVWRGPVPRAPR